MTSFHGSTVKAHLAAKGIKTDSGTEAAERSGHLRVVTASKPHAKDVLKLRNGKGMKRDSSYVGIRRTYIIELRALALYGFGKEEVDAYRLTAHATKKLLESIRKRAKITKVRKASITKAKKSRVEPVQRKIPTRSNSDVVMADVF